MKSISESIIGKKGGHRHRITWDKTPLYNNTMYDDPEDIIAMLLSGNYIVFNDEGEYRISKNADLKEIGDLGFNAGYHKKTLCIPINTFVFAEEAIPRLEEEGYKIKVEPILHLHNWSVAYIDK